MENIYVKRRTQQGASEVVGMYRNISEGCNAVRKDAKNAGLDVDKFVTYPRRNGKFLVDIGNKNTFYTVTVK